MHPVEGRQKSRARPQKRKNGNNKKGTREEMGKTSLRAIGRPRWIGGEAVFSNIRFSNIRIRFSEQCQKFEYRISNTKLHKQKKEPQKVAFLEWVRLAPIFYIV